LNVSKSTNENEECSSKNLLQRLVPSLALSIFGGVGLALLLVISGLFKADLQNPEPAVLECLLTGAPFVAISTLWIFASVFISTGRHVESLEPTSTQRKRRESLLALQSFLAVITGGVLMAHQIMPSVDWAWWWLIATVTLGGLCSVFHGWFMYFVHTRSSIDNGLKNAKDVTIFVKGLELEHNFFSTYLQLFTSAIMVFITAGVVAYFLKPSLDQPLQPQSSSVSVLNAILMGTWLVVGIFFGLFSPLQNHVEHVRETVRSISLTKWGAPVRLLQKIEQKKKQIDDLVAENVRLKTRITRLELESTEMEKRVKMIEKKLSGL
jgi:hypothetical protein